MDLSLISPGLLLAVLVAITLGALLKGMTGLGLPIFAVPALAMITSVEEAVVLMVIPGVGANLWLVFSHRKYMATLKDHLPFLIAGFLGGLLGTYFLYAISDRGLKIFLVIWLGLYLLTYFTRRSSLGVFGGRGIVAWPLGFAAGTLQGASGISAQIVAPYYHVRGLTLKRYAFVTAFTFLLFSMAQLTAMVNFNLFSPERLQLGLLALIPTLIFTRIGIGLTGKLSTITFNRILLITFILMEAKLIMDISQ